MRHNWRPGAVPAVDEERERAADGQGGGDIHQFQGGGGPVAVEGRRGSGRGGVHVRCQEQGGAGEVHVQGHG